MRYGEKPTTAESSSSEHRRWSYGETRMGGASYRWWGALCFLPSKTKAYMNNLFLILFFLSISGLIIGLIKPRLILRKEREKLMKIGYRKVVGALFSCLVVLFFILFAITLETPPRKQAQEPSPAAQTPPEKSLSQEVKNGTVLVTRVIDGDTIEIEGGQKIRYIGIDTPETVDPRKPVQCFGVEASKRNKELVEGKRVSLEKDIGEIDKYGRLVRYVYVGDVFINLVLVREGFAHSYTYPPDIKYQNQFIEAERLAREQKKGLWGSCPTSLTPTTATPSSQASLSSMCTIKGNITEEKIYHTEGCGSYEKTQIDEARGERWFCTEEEAVAAGWRKAKNCP